MPETIQTSDTTSEAHPRFTVAMSARDLINIGIFAALYTVVVYAIGMFGLISPMAMLVSLCVSIVAGGIPFLLFLTRVKHAGMVLVFATLIAGGFLLTGHVAISFVLMIALAVGVEAILWLGRYRSRWALIASYTLFALWYIGPLLPLFYAREEYLTGPSWQSVGSDYVAQLDALFSLPVLTSFAVATVILGFLGALLGARLLGKHFVKAGLA